MSEKSSSLAQVFVVPVVVVNIGTEDLVGLTSLVTRHIETYQVETLPCSTRNWILLDPGSSKARNWSSTVEQRHVESKAFIVQRCARVTNLQDASALLCLPQVNELSNTVPKNHNQ